MVSTDGPRVTPEDPDSPNGDHTDENNTSDESTTAVADHDAPIETDENGSSTVAPKQSRKQKPPRQKKTRIDQLVMEFQPDAVEIEHRRVAGGLRWTLYVVVLLLIATVAWAYWAQVDRLVTAEGKLITKATPVVIQSVSTSPIKTINVKFGDVVHAGDVVATLDPTYTSADVAKLQSQVNGLEAKRTRLIAEQRREEFDIAGHEGDIAWLTEQNVYVQQKAAYEAKLAEFAAEGRQLDAQKNRNEAEIKTLEERFEIEKLLHQKAVDLENKGAGSENETLAALRQASHTELSLITAKNQLIETEAEMDSMQKRKETYIAELNSKISVDLAQTSQDFTAATEELNKALRSDELAVLRVPDDLPNKVFKVLEVVEHGSVLETGKPIAKLVPLPPEDQSDDVALELEIKVDAKDVARIREGDSVRIKFTSLPYMKHGTRAGVIRTISEDSFVEGQPPMSKTFYKVRVSLLPEGEDSTLINVPDDFRLVPGMTTVAEIKIGRRRVLEYFLYPIIRAWDSSIREP